MNNRVNNLMKCLDKDTLRKTVEVAFKQAIDENRLDHDQLFHIITILLSGGDAAPCSDEIGLLVEINQRLVEASMTGNFIHRDLEWVSHSKIYYDRVNDSAHNWGIHGIVDTMVTGIVNAVRVHPDVCEAFIDSILGVKHDYITNVIDELKYHNDSYGQSAVKFGERGSFITLVQLCRAHFPKITHPEKWVWVYCMKTTMDLFDLENHPPIPVMPTGPVQ
jgi:hypothetical protein